MNGREEDQKICQREKDGGLYGSVRTDDSGIGDIGRCSEHANSVVVDCWRSEERHSF